MPLKMNKKAHVYNLIPYVVLFFFISLIAMTSFMFYIGMYNDYFFFELQSVTEDLESEGLILNGSSQMMLDGMVTFQSLPTYFDRIWLVIYVFFVISSLYYAYAANKVNLFSFPAFLMYGLMFVMYVLDFFDQIMVWWRDNILYAILPNTLYTAPMFSYCMNHAAIFVLIHIVAIMLINQLDFDLVSSIDRKKKEQNVIGDQEVF